MPQPSKPDESVLSALLAQPVIWPPRERGGVDAFITAVGERQTPLEGYELRTRTSVAAKVNHLRRCILIKNLKAGSSTADTLVSSLGREGRGKRIFKTSNETALMIECLEKPTAEECATRWALANNIPDEVMDKYLIFSFVRDPFTRVVSSHHEVGSAPFTELIMGKHAKVSSNAHVLSQVS